MERLRGGGEGKRMPFLLMDDRFWSHPKVLAAGNEAVGYWARSIAYCAQHLTDGKLPRAGAVMLCGTEEELTRVAAHLVAHRLWDVCTDGDGWVVHDYLDWNRSSKQVKHLKKKNQQRVAAHRSRNALHVHYLGEDRIGDSGSSSGSSSEREKKGAGEKEGARLVLEPESPTPPAFDRFWAAYPRPIGKARAREVWRRLTPDTALVEQMLATLAWQVEDAEWTRDDGRFIPHPATWLNQRRWEDERPPDVREARNRVVLAAIRERERTGKWA